MQMKAECDRFFRKMIENNHFMNFMNRKSYCNLRKTIHLNEFKLVKLTKKRPLVMQTTAVWDRDIYFQMSPN